MQNLWIRLCSKRKKETDCNINIISWTNEFVRILRSQYFKKKSSYQFQFFVFFWNSINARPTNTPMKYRLFSTLLQKKLQAYPCSVSRPKKAINLKGCAMNDKSFKFQTWQSINERSCLKFTPRKSRGLSENLKFPTVDLVLLLSK